MIRLDAIREDAGLSTAQWTRILGLLRDELTRWHGRARRERNHREDLDLLTWGGKYLPRHFSRPPSRMHGWLARRLDSMRFLRGVKLKHQSPKSPYTPNGWFVAEEPFVEYTRHGMGEPISKPGHATAVWCQVESWCMFGGSGSRRHTPPSSPSHPQALTRVGVVVPPLVQVEVMWWVLRLTSMSWS